MSDPASIAIVILVAFQLVLLIALAVVAVLASISIIEATALTRRVLRKNHRKVNQIGERIETVLEEKVVDPVSRFERGAAWVESLTHNLGGELADRTPEKR